MSSPVVGAEVSVGADVEFGAHVTVHDGTVIGDGCRIEDGVVLGKRPRLAPGSAAAGLPVDGLRLGAGVTVCCGAVVFAGAVVGDGAIVGDQSYVRERTVVGAGSVVGRGSVLDNDVVVGSRVRIQTNVYITARSVIEDDVFVGPGVCTTNDDTMGRHGADYALCGATLRRACRIGGGSVLVPGVVVGEEAYVAAGRRPAARRRDGGAGARRRDGRGRGSARAVAGVRLPPSRLMRRVGWVVGDERPADVFEERGREQWELIKSLAEMDLAGKRALDFGCGVGRILRPAAAADPGCEFWGCDIDQPSIDWLGRSLPGLTLRRNGAWPPLDAPAEHFDLIWAF